MARSAQNDKNDNPFGKYLSKWQGLQPAAPQKDSHRAICWLAGVGAVLHPVFAYLPTKWPLGAMDGFLVLIVLIVLWHERNGPKG